MNVKYHHNFVKNFKKRFENNNNIQVKYEERLKLFIENRHNPILQDHPLKGTRIKLRSFSITGDVRVVYTIIDGIAYLLDIGTHNQIY